jgi:hypothetical protein
MRDRSVKNKEGSRALTDYDRLNTIRPIVSECAVSREQSPR